MDKGRVVKAVRNAAIILLIMFGMVWAKTYFSGRAQYMAGEKALQDGNLSEAITDYETAIHMYTPFSAYVPASAERLWEIGQGFEKSGDYDWALISYRALRSSFYAVRSFYSPYREWIERSEGQIDAVLAEQAQHQAQPPAGPKGAGH